MRGIALALQSVTDDLGRSLGPILVAGFISALGRTGAFNVAVGGWVPCGMLVLALALTMARDEDAMQSSLAEAVAWRAQGDGGTDGSGGQGDADVAAGDASPLPLLTDGREVQGHDGRSSELLSDCRGEAAVEVVECRPHGPTPG